MEFFLLSNRLQSIAIYTYFNRFDSYQNPFYSAFFGTDYIQILYRIYTDNVQILYLKKYIF